MFSFFGTGGEIKQMLLCACRYLYKGLRVEYKALILKALMKSILESNKINTWITKNGSHIYSWWSLEANRDEKSVFGLCNWLGRWQYLYHETQQLSEQLVHWHFNANPKNTVSSNDISREIVTTSHIQRQVQSVVPQVQNYLIKI